MGKIKIDWLLAQQDYLSRKETSLTDIANKYVISLSQVKKVAAKKKWKQMKDDMWKRAYITSYKEVLDSTEQYTTRRLKIARYLQNVSLWGLNKCFEILRVIKPSPRFLSLYVKILSMGMKLERELYPKELIHKVAREMYEKEKDNHPTSPQLEKIYYEVFKAELTGNKVELIIKNHNNDKVFEYKYDF